MFHFHDKVQLQLTLLHKLSQTQQNDEKTVERRILVSEYLFYMNVTKSFEFKLFSSTKSCLSLVADLKRGFDL